MEIPCQDVESWLGPVGLAPGRDIEACLVSRQFNLRGRARRHLVPDREGLWRHGGPDTGRESKHYRSQSDTRRHNSYAPQFSHIDFHPSTHASTHASGASHTGTGDEFLCQPLPDLRCPPYPERARGLLVAMASGTGDRFHVGAYPSTHASGTSRARTGEAFHSGRG